MTIWYVADYMTILSVAHILCCSWMQKNALLGGALTGAALSLTEPNPRSDRVVRGAITGGAIATAAEFLRSLT